MSKSGDIGGERFLLKKRIFGWNSVDERFGATGNMECVLDFRVGHEFIIPNNRSMPRPMPEQGGRVFILSIKSWE